MIYAKGDNDECYTPAYAVAPLLEYIPRNKVIWCPFDTEQSEFVKVLSSAGHDVVYSHIDNGQDFYTYEPPIWDLIISNPPFTNKRDIFRRALSFEKPFALLMTMAWLNDSAPIQLFMERGMQLLMFDKRIEYMQAKQDTKSKCVTFASGYYCADFLPQQIELKQLHKQQLLLGV